MAAEAYSEMGGSPRDEDEEEELSDAELDDRGTEDTTKKQPTFNNDVYFSFPYYSCFVLLVHVSTFSSVS